MYNFPVLSVIIFSPLVGALLIYILSAFTKYNKEIIYKYIALGVSLFTFLLTLQMFANFDRLATGYQFIEKLNWINGYEIFYYLGIDGISVYFVILTAFLLPICILTSWNSINTKIKDYYILFLMMETFVLGSFCALDFLLFYIFFEAVLIPMYLIIGIWGGQNRVYAAYKFFLYTLAGSVLLLIAIVYIYFQAGTTDITLLVSVIPGFSLDVQKWLWLAFFASFAVKIPMFPFHTWLPDAHVQAPTAGSVILAGILLKLGGYGFLRFSLPMLPSASLYFADLVIILSIIAVVYTSLVALMQDDMKKMIAYSSIAHMGYVTAGIFTFNEAGVNGALFQMISHGIVSGALFMCVGVLYERMHTKEIAFYNGLTSRMPKFAFQFMVFTLASVGLPSTSGFVGEFMVLKGVFENSNVYSGLLALGMVFGAAYMLWLFARVMYGEIKNTKLLKIADLGVIEKIAFWPIAILVFILGCYPAVIFDYTTVSVNTMIAHVKDPRFSSIANMKAPESYEIIIEMDEK